MLMIPREYPAEHKIAVLKEYLPRTLISNEEWIYAHSTVHTEPICDSQGKKAGFDGKGQGELGDDWVL